MLAAALVSFIGSAIVQFIAWITIIPDRTPTTASIRSDPDDPSLLTNLSLSPFVTDDGGGLEVGWIF